MIRAAGLIGTVLTNVLVLAPISVMAAEKAAVIALAEETGTAEPAGPEAVASPMNATVQVDAPKETILKLTDGRIDVGFEVYWGGFRIGLLDLASDVSAERYALTVRFRTAGMLSMMTEGESRGEAEGRFDGGSIKPARYQTRSLWNDKLRHLDLVFVNGEARLIDAVPPPSEDREHVPPSMRHGLDPLALAMSVARNPGENGQARRELVYDGVRAVEFEWACPREEVLIPTSYSNYRGPALRCEVTGKQIGGFHKKYASRNFQLESPAVVWLAPVVGGAAKLYLPVRLTMDTQYGGLMAHLVRVGPPADATENSADGKRKGS